VGGTGYGSASAELYDPAADTWSAAPSMGTPREGQTATLLGSGKVLVVGGADGNGGILPGAEVYTPMTTATVEPGDFSTLNVGQSSPVEYLSVTNTGDEPLFVTSTDISGTDAADFSVASDGCANTTVGPGDTCLLGLSFTPAGGGPRSATLTV